MSTKLYPDSYIEYNYTPNTPPAGYGQIPLTLETNRLGNNISSGNIFIPNNVDLLEAKITSYSADKWTYSAGISNSNGENIVFNLSRFGLDHQLFRGCIPCEYTSKHVQKERE